MLWVSVADSSVRTAVDFLFDQLESIVAGGKLFHEFASAVGRCIVDDEHFDVSVTLSRQAGERGVNELFTVENRQQHRDLWSVHLCRNPTDQGG